MRLLAFTFSSVLLVACATTPEVSTQVSNKSVPSSSELSPGQCGLFGWSSKGENLEFVFYADENSARYDSADGPIDIVAQSDFPATDYLDDSGNSVTLRLGAGEVMSDGTRYPSARVVTLTDDGWERLHPVAIVQICKPKETGV